MSDRRGALATQIVRIENARQSLDLRGVGRTQPSQPVIGGVALLFQPMGERSKPRPVLVDGRRRMLFRAGNDRIGDSIHSSLGRHEPRFTNQSHYSVMDFFRNRCDDTAQNL